MRRINNESTNNDNGKWVFAFIMGLITGAGLLYLILWKVALG